MKDYISLLSNEDLGYICKVIGGKILKEIFKKNAGAFNKLRPGFRPGNLSDEDAFSFTVKNKNISFISSFLNKWIDDRLNEIKEYKAQRLNEDGSEELALANTLPFSVFDENPSIYFLLTETQPPHENTELFYRLIEITRRNKKLLSDISESDSSAADNENQQTIKEEFEATIEQIQSKHEKELEDERTASTILKDTISRMTVELSSKDETISSLREELKEYRERENYRVPVAKIVPSEDYSYVSLCKVYTDGYGASRLLRLADIRDGEISEMFLTDAPGYKNLYRKDGPSREGFIGIWNWKTVPNNNDPGRDYIMSAYNNSSAVVEVIWVHECNNVTELIEKLKNGISVSYHTDTVFLVVYNGDSFDGILCNTSFMDMQTNNITLKASILKLPIYVVPMNNVFKFDDISIMTLSSVGIPLRITRVKEPIELVKDIIVSRVSWTVMQQQGFMRNEYRQIRDFLIGFQTADLYEEICRRCDCSNEEAKRFVDSFVARSKEYYLGEILENDIMAQIIRNDPVMYESCLEELTKDWEKQNQEAINSANTALTVIQTKKQESECKYNELTKQCDILEQQLFDIRDKIAAQEQMAQEVQDRVLNKIEQARNNAAEFIAENAFIHVSKPISEDLKDKAEKAEKQPDTAFFPGEFFDSKEAEENDNYNQLLQTIQCELCEAGVTDASVVGLSAFLYSAYINRIPLLLAGPNGFDIARAFSASINCRIPAVLKCCGEIDIHSLKECQNATEDIVVIEYPFQSSWENHIINLISKRDKFFIMLHPFAEDLVIEPRGLLNYCIPILTELFVDRLATSDYIGGRLTEKYAPFTPKKLDRNYEKLLTSMRVSSIAKTNIQRLISDAKALLDSRDIDSEYRTLLYPAAFVLGERDAFSEWLDREDQKPSAALLSLLKNLMGNDE